MRTCSVCKLSKQITEFYTSGKYISSRCKECQKQLSKEAWKKDYETNPEKFKTRSRANYKKDPDNHNRKVAEWRKANPAKRSSIVRKYDSAHKQQRAANEARRRARKRDSLIEVYDRIEIYNLYSGICALCSEQIDLSLEWPHPMSFSIDHTVPLALGGSDTPDNVAPSHLLCNLQKGARV